MAKLYSNSTVFTWFCLWTSISSDDYADMKDVMCSSHCQRTALHQLHYAVLLWELVHLISFLICSYSSRCFVCICIIFKFLLHSMCSFYNFLSNGSCRRDLYQNHKHLLLGAAKRNIIDFVNFLSCYFPVFSPPPFLQPFFFLSVTRLPIFLFPASLSVTESWC